MVMDWLTAAGLVSALVAVVGNDLAARRSNQTRPLLRTPLTPRFRTLAAGELHDKLEYPCREDLQGE